VAFSGQCRLLPCRPRRHSAGAGRTSCRSNLWLHVTLPVQAGGPTSMLPGTATAAKLAAERAPPSGLAHIAAAAEHPLSCHLIRAGHPRGRVVEGPAGLPAVGRALPARGGHRGPVQRGRAVGGAVRRVSSCYLSRYAASCLLQQSGLLWPVQRGRAVGGAVRRVSSCCLCEAECVPGFPPGLLHRPQPLASPHSPTVPAFTLIPLRFPCSYEDDRDEGEWVSPPAACYCCYDAACAAAAAPKLLQLLLRWCCRC